MTGAPKWLRWSRLLPSDVRGEVDDELAFHLDMRTRDLVAAGMAPAAAREEAERQFGELRRIRDACVTIDERRQRRTHRTEVMTDMLQDLRLAARTLRRSPGFTATAVACIALGIGVTTTIFSAVNAILLRPLPYPRADELVAVYAQNPDRGIYGANVSWPDYASWRDESRALAALGMWTWTSLAVGGGAGEVERVEGSEVTANLFPLLGVRPVLGRAFSAGDQTPGRDRVALLSYGLWQRRFGGDRGVVGRSVQVDGLPYTVVGVMPPRFNFPQRGQLWVPFTVDQNAQERANRMYAGAIGRLKPGVTVEQARADLAAVSARLQREYPGDNFGWAAEVIPLRDDLVGDLRRPLLVFLGAVAFVLLIACANVANLMLARGATRQREVAIRVAIGAGRGRLVRQIMTESVLIAALGGALGVLLARYGVRLIALAFPDDVPFYISLHVDGATLLFAALTAGLTGVLFGVLPALRSTRLDVAASLRDGARDAGSSVARSRVRSALVVAEIALSLVLMAGAALLLRSYQALQGTDLGFEERGILSVRISLPLAKYPARATRAEFYDRLFERVRAMPGVQVVGSAQGIPFSGWNVQAELSVEGRPAPAAGQELDAHYQWITPDFFKAIGVPLERGRGFTAADRDSTSPVAIVNETLARRVFGGEDPIGRRMRIGGAGSSDPWATIVGVARDYRHYRLSEPMGPAIYFPYAAVPLLQQTLAIRTSLADPLALAPAVRAAIRELDPDVPAYEVQTFEQAVSRSLWRQRLQGQVLGTFALLALALAAVGLYGVVAYAVAQRTRELGVRMALGATRRDVVSLVLGQGARLTLAGVAIGAVASLALTRLLASLLYGVRATDPATLAGVSAVLAGVALAATYVPARRAARVDPLVAMRSE